MKTKYLITLIIFLSVNISFAQFGQNKVQYKNSQWFFIQSKHFDIYFSNGAERIAEFTAASAENALEKLQVDMNYRINNRITLIVYNSHNDFQETNVTDQYTGQGVGGFTEPFKNRVVFPFEGSYQKFGHVIYHELVHAVMQDMFYGGSIQNIITKGITLQLPHWFMEGSAEFLSQGWETNTDMFIRNAIISESLPNINQLTGYLGYRGGQSVFKYIADTYGRQKIGELMNKIQSLGSFEGALKASIGIGTEELSERWKKSLKKEYWPDIAVKDDPDEFAKRLTNNKKDGGFYNMSPAFSPQGDKIAFISDRDIYLDVYIMNATDGKVIKKVVESGKATNFEELNILHPSLTWAPDNKRIALSSKNKGYDVITIIDTETEESYDLPFNFSGIESVSWSYNGNKIAFNAHNSMQSDIYVYDFKNETLDNLTSDIFSDFDPSWSPDGTKIFFSSDRGEPDSRYHADDFMMFDHNFKQLDLYMIDFESREIERITNWEFSNEKSVVVSPEGNEILFVSDKNGINNIYKKSITKDEKNLNSSLVDLPAYPITNSLSEINQLSLSNDGKKLAFTSLYNLGYNIFTLNNPFELKLGVDSLQLTAFMKQLIKNKSGNPEIFIDEKITNEKDSLESFANADSTKNQQKRIFTGQYTSTKADADTNKTDYSKYVFGNVNQAVDSSRIINRQLLFSEKLDDSGNFLVNKYKINFSPDLVYANAGYSTLYGLLGTTILSFSDVLGNHRLVGITSLQIDVKNSDYGLAYYYLENRLDIGIEAFHTARFLYRFGLFGSELYRFRNFGAVVSASYPFDRFYRLDASLSLMSVTSENLDNIFVPSEKATFVVPSISYIHDNVMWGYTSPIEGTRFNFTVFGNPGISNKRQSFYSVVWDYRKYFRFWFDNGFAFRLSGGFSGGGNPQRFFMGGIDNWINRNFATQDIPVTNASDFAFLSPAMPLRGYDYAEKIASKYSLLNLELRMPLIRFLLTGPLPIFFQNILGVAFIDAGAAWDNSETLKLFKKDQYDNTVTQDLLIGTGVGLRLYFLFLWRFDVAWKYNLDGFSTPRYYISIGLDF
jgi:Tol biopolymer transport system component